MAKTDRQIRNETFNLAMKSGLHPSLTGAYGYEAHNGDITDVRELNKMLKKRRRG